MFVIAALLATPGRARRSIRARPGKRGEDGQHRPLRVPSRTTLEVAKGTKVVFSNSSATAHTATDKGAFDSGRIKPGRSFAVRFKQKGTFRYHCEIHPFMHGKIVVG